jgi:hypothetical protein
VDGHDYPGHGRPDMNAPDEAERDKNTLRA